MKPDLLKRAGESGQPGGLESFRSDRMAAVIDRVPANAPRATYAKLSLRDTLLEHREYIEPHGKDLPEIRNWKRISTP